MMGGFQDRRVQERLDRSVPGFRASATVLLAALALVLLGVPDAPADPSPPTQLTSPPQVTTGSPDRDAVAERSGESPVATPADPRGSTAPRTAAREAAAPTPTLPLTRAAERARIEAISPRSWLANFGPVVVESQP